MPGGKGEHAIGEGDLAPMLGARLRVLFQAINDRIAADLAAAGFRDLRPAHFVVFQHLGPSARATDLAGRAQMTKQSMGALVDDLERWGYVERVPDPADGRARIIRRTERGWAIDRIARAAVRDLDAEWAQQVGDDRMEVFRGVLTELGASIESGRPETGNAPTAAARPVGATPPR